MCEREARLSVDAQPQAGKKSISQGAKRESLERKGSLLTGWRKSLDVIFSTMGCSICTLQKPQEHYKLLYEVCQVLWPTLRERFGECFALFFFANVDISIMFSDFAGVTAGSCSWAAWTLAAGVSERWCAVFEGGGVMKRWQLSQCVC